MRLTATSARGDDPPVIVFDLSGSHKTTSLSIRNPDPPLSIIIGVSPFDGAISNQNFVTEAFSGIAAENLYVTKSPCSPHCLL